MRAARAEPRLALGGDVRAADLALLGLDDLHARGNAGAHVLGQLGLVQAPRDGLGDHRRGQLVTRRQQPLATRHRPLAAGVVTLVELAEHARAHVLAPVVEFLLERVFEDLPFLLDHQDLVETGGELACVARFERPHATDLEDANADAPADRLVEPQVGERLAHVEIGLAGGDDAEARVRGIDDDPVQAVGTHVGECRVALVM